MSRHPRDLVSATWIQADRWGLGTCDQRQSNNDRHGVVPSPAAAHCSRRLVMKPTEQTLEVAAGTQSHNIPGSIRMPTSTMPRQTQLAFFSYSREDTEFAQRLAKDLRASGAAIWLDRLDISPGQQWDHAVENALENSSRLLVILSPSSVGSTNVMDEVSVALEDGKTVIPVLYRDCKIPFR